MTDMKGASSSSCDISSDSFLRLSMLAKMGERKAEEGVGSSPSQKSCFVAEKNKAMKQVWWVKVLEEGRRRRRE